jgi:hypothetical protein
MKDRAMQALLLNGFWKATSKTVSTTSAMTGYWLMFRQIA